MVEIRLATPDERIRFAARHMELVTWTDLGPIEACSCGWLGQGWRCHVETAYSAWLHDRRVALRARLLREEGVAEP